MPEDAKLSVLVPAYNEAEVIGATIERVAAVLSGAGLSWEIVVADDGSTDGTFDAAARAAGDGRRIRVLSLGVNQGKGAALRHAFKASRGAWIAFFDADLDIDPGQLPDYLRTAADTGTDVLVACKHHPDSDIRYPVGRTIASRVYALVVRAAFDLPVHDTQTGLKLFRREVLDSVFDRVQVSRFAFDVELLVLARRAGFEIREAPVRVSFHRDNARIRVWDYVVTGLDTLLVLGRLLASRERDRPP